MKNKLWIIFGLFVVAIIFGFYVFSQNKDFSKNNVDSENTYTGNNIDYKNTYTENNINSENASSQIEVEAKTEEIISSFSTKIYTKESSRQNNISITCSTLSGTVVPNGSVFSFCDTVGQATSAKGYQESDIFDNNGNKKKGLGGGNCQVSTTLYNAVLKIPSLVVVERHEHSNKVPYIETGKDAAVAYGSYDLKFRNDTGFDIKIIASNNSDAVDISLYKLMQ